MQNSALNQIDSSTQLPDSSNPLEALRSLLPQQALDKLMEEALSQMRAENEAQERFKIFRPFRFDPIGYIKTFLKWTPWSGGDRSDGQAEVLEAYRLALLQLHERRDFEHGLITEKELTAWKPGMVIKNRFRIEAGHTVGKTKLAAGIFSHFFDTCAPSIIYSFAPTLEQINDLLWKEIRVDRNMNLLPGRVLQIPELKLGENHFARGKATQNSKGTGTERVQGQHGEYLMFILDEAEGMDEWLWNGIESMTSGGIVIVIMLANPRTRSSEFFKQRLRQDVQNFRISCIDHPNVIQDKEIVPNAVRRQYVNNMIDKHCSITPAHNPDYFTFEVEWMPGVIFEPNNEFLFRVLGIAPKMSSDKTFFPSGRFEAALDRKSWAQTSLPAFNSKQQNKAQLGIDVARFGSDMGNVYVLRGGHIWRAAQFGQQDSTAYYRKVKDILRGLMMLGVTHVSVRIDAGGGYGSGLIDLLRKDPEIREWLSTFTLHEVHFNGKAKDQKSYFDVITELYAQSSEVLKGCAIKFCGETLEGDLVDREYEWINRKGVEVRKLTTKEEFKNRHFRSPDEGDGFCLCLAPEFLFRYRNQRKSLRAYSSTSSRSLK